MHIFPSLFLSAAFVSTVVQALPTIPGSDNIKRTNGRNLVVFGDSISDNGNVLKLTDGRWPPYPYFKGRFSNGPVWNEIVTADWNSKLRNYAYGSATSGCVAGATEGGKTPVPDARHQVDQYLKDGVDKDALHVVEFGANDVFFTAFGLAPVPATGQCILNHVSAAMWKLIDAGVQNVVVFEMPRYDSMPIIQNTSPDVLTHAKSLSTAYNLGLPAAVANQERAAKAAGKQVNIRVVPLYSMITDMLNDPPAPISIKSEACLKGLELCQQAKDDGNQAKSYFYYDDAHFTKFVHIELAKKFEAWY